MVLLKQIKGFNNGNLDFKYSILRGGAGADEVVKACVQNHPWLKLPKLEV
jgi:hypothetical protein